MAGRKKMDPISEAAVEMVEMERSREELARQEQVNREALMAQYHQAVGQIKTANMFAEFANISALVWIQQMQETKAYREIGTWENFCKSIGFSRQHIDDQLKNLATLGEKFLQTVCGLGVGYRELRKLRQLTHEGVLQIEDGVLVIGDEAIPLDAEHHEDLQAAMERVIETNAKIIADKDATIKAKDKVLKDKQTLIERQAKELGRLEDAAAMAEMTPVEEAFVRKMENHRVSFDGYMLKVDPERCELATDPERTARMAVAYLTTLDYMRKQLLVAYDVAQELYGSAVMSPEDAWTPSEE